MTDPNSPAPLTPGAEQLRALVLEASEIMQIVYAGNFPAGIESFLVRADAALRESVPEPVSPPVSRQEHRLPGEHWVTMSRRVQATWNCPPGCPAALKDGAFHLDACRPRTCTCGATRPESARYGHSHLAWCASAAIPVPEERPPTIGGDGPPEASCLLCGISGLLTVWYAGTRAGVCERCRKAARSYSNEAEERHPQALVDAMNAGDWKEAAMLLIANQDRLYREGRQEPEEGTDVVAWLKSKGFVLDRENWCIAWSCRSGHDFTDLEFYPLRRHANDVGWDAIVGHHASGTNPRLIIGRCETLTDVQMVYETLRRINGYPSPENSGDAEKANTNGVRPPLSAEGRAPTGPETEADNSVVLAAHAYAERCHAATGQRFEIGALTELQAWFYAGARWRADRPNADVTGPQSTVCAAPTETRQEEPEDQA